MAPKFDTWGNFIKKSLGENWIPCDLLWILRFVGFECAMRLKGIEEYCPKKIESKKFWSTMIIPNPYKKH
jgi:hypothetical protein